MTTCAVLHAEIYSDGAMPWSELSDTDVLARVRAGNKLGSPAGCPSEVQGVMSGCWSIDPALRLTASGALHKLQAASVTLRCESTGLVWPAPKTQDSTGPAPPRQLHITTQPRSDAADNDDSDDETSKHTTVLAATDQHSTEAAQAVSAYIRAVARLAQPAASMELVHTDLHVERELGKGAFGVVRLATVQGARVAVKLCQVGDDVAQERFVLEAKLLASLSHAHVVCAVGLCTSARPYFVAMELMGGGDLRTYLQRAAQQTSTHVSCTDMTDICMQVADAMVYLSSLNIIHRDIAARCVHMCKAYVTTHMHACAVTQERACQQCWTQHSEAG